MHIPVRLGNQHNRVIGTAHVICGEVTIDINDQRIGESLMRGEEVTLRISTKPQEKKVGN